MTIPYRSITRCRGCGHHALAEVLAMEPMPLAGQFCLSPEEAARADRIPLTWVQCGRCELAQVVEDVDDEFLFSAYNYASSTVPGLVRHFAAYAEHLADRFRGADTKVLEIGCNDGVLLGRLPPTWTRVGVDPSDVARERAAAGYELVNLPFSAGLAETLSGHGTFDLVTGSNCLAHIHDLRDVFLGAWTMLRPGGELVLEVHDLEATLAGGQWDTIYHEHKVEWSERSLSRCLEPIGFERVAVARLPLHGGLLRATFRKVRPGPAKEQGAPDAAQFEPIRRAYERRRETPVYRALTEIAKSGGALSGYGAAGRANVWINQLPELPLRYIVAESPLRAGKWLPSVAIPVVTPAHFRSDPTAACVITAWNYAPDIQRKHPEYRGRWLQTFEG